MIARYTGADGVPATALDLVKVSHTIEYDGNRLPVLDQLDLRIEPGELVALLGPRGCGKSTLLRLVAGRERPSSGTIMLDGEPGAAAPHLVLSRDPALSASKTVHAQVTAARNNRRGPEDATPNADEALRLLGLNRFAGAFPRELTAATAQRVSLATALVNDPRLLLLDDPFGRLDPITRTAIQSDFLSLWQRRGFTALFATSDVDEALSVASRVIVLGARAARIAQNLTLDCEFPRRSGDPDLAGTRRLLLQSLDGVGTGPSARALATRRAEPFARVDNLTPMIWHGERLAQRCAAALA